MEPITCKVCLGELDANDFYKDKTTKSGKKSMCKNCYKLYRHKEINIVEQKVTENLYQDFPPFRISYLFRKGKEYNPAVMIAATRGSGKSTLIVNWVFEMEKLFDLIIFFCQSLQAPVYGAWKNSVVAKKTVFLPGLNDEIIKEVEAIQRKSKNALRWMVISDDDTDLAHKKNSKFFMDLFLRGRNERCAIFWAGQEVNLLHKYNRNNIDDVVMMWMNNNDSRLALVNAYLSGNDTIEIPEKYKRRKYLKVEYLLRWLKDNTQNFRTLVLDTQSEKIYSYKSKKLFDNFNEKLKHGRKSEEIRDNSRGNAKEVERYE
jgi:hypothetical protein